MSLPIEIKKDDNQQVAESHISCGTFLIATNSWRMHEMSEISTSPKAELPKFWGKWRRSPLFRHLQLRRRVAQVVAHGRVVLILRREKILPT
jgi:hypothetical protein